MLKCFVAIEITRKTDVTLSWFNQKYFAIEFVLSKCNPERLGL